MTATEDNYHIIFPGVFPGRVVLQPDDATGKRPYAAQELIPGKPLTFTNAFASEQDARGEPEQLTDLVFGAFSFGVRDFAKERLAALPIDGLQFYPMTYLDRSGILHSDFWYVNIFEYRRFLDRERSTYVAGAGDSDDERPWVLRYALDSRVMEAAPEDSRLIFRLDGVFLPYTFVHERVIALLSGTTGWRSFRVSDYQEGMQHRP